MVAAEHALGNRVETELTTVRFGELVLVLVCGHVVRAPAIDDRHPFGAEPFGLRGSVDRGVARADHDDAPADSRFPVRMTLEILDEHERV